MTTADRSMARGSTPPTDLQGLLGLIPSGPLYDDLRNTLVRVDELFPDAMGTINADRVRAWVAEIQSGTGRTDAEIRSDIFRFVVTPEAIMDETGATEAEADQLIAGTLTFSDLGALASGGVPTGAASLPDDLTLVKVNNPAGSDKPAIYYLVGEWNGVKFAYEVGDKERLEEAYGGEAAFDEKQTMNQGRFDGAGYVVAGDADQLLGANEDFTSLMERETREAGFEDLPEWMDNSPDALAIVAQGAAMGWSPGRIWEELSGTDAFQERFGLTIGIYTQGGGTIQDAVQNILADEAAIARTVRRYGEPGAQYDSEYFQRALSQGWDAQSAAQVLEATNQLVRNPRALRDANAVLVASGIAPVNEVGFINLLMGNAPDDVTEALNTAFAGQALREAGIDVDMDLLLDVVDTTDRVLTADSFREIAGELAFNFARFGTEFDRQEFGLSEDDLIATIFGRDPGGSKTQGEVMNALARFERNRRAQAGGTAGAQGFLNQEGRLQFQGTGT